MIFTIDPPLFKSSSRDILSCQSAIKSAFFEEEKLKFCLSIKTSHAFPQHALKPIFVKTSTNIIAPLALSFEDSLPVRTKDVYCELPIKDFFRFDPSAITTISLTGRRVTTITPTSFQEDYSPYITWQIVCKIRHITLPVLAYDGEDHEDKDVITHDYIDDLLSIFSKKIQYSHTELPRDVSKSCIIKDNAIDIPFTFYASTQFL